MALRPPSWYAAGPCDVLSLDHTEAEYAWARAAAAAGDPEGVVAWAAAMHAGIAAQFLTTRNAHWVAAVAALRALEVADSHPNAGYLMGRIDDPANACEHYERGWRRFKNIGCAFSLAIALPKGSVARNTATDRCVRFVLSPDCLALARASGSTSAMADALWLSAEALKKDAEPSAFLGPSDSLEDALLRLYDLGAGLGDPCAMAAGASRRMRVPLGGMRMEFPSARGEELCAQALAHPDASPGVKSVAFALIGAAALRRGEKAAARRAFEAGVAVCERAGGKWLESMDQEAVESLVYMCCEAVGGPHDVARGAVVHAHGVRLGFGPSLELAAEWATARGDLVSAMEYWSRAAAREMPRAMSIVEGIPLAEAERRCDPFGGMLSTLETHSLCGFGGSGGPPGIRVVKSLAATMPPPVACSGCDKRGRFAGAAHASTDDDASPPLEELPVAVLCERLAALGIARAPGAVEKSELVAGLTAALARVAAQPVLLACGRCRGAFYCAASCQRADWAKHRPSCKARIPNSGVGAAPAAVPSAP